MATKSFQVTAKLMTEFSDPKYNKEGFVLMHESYN